VLPDTHETIQFDEQGVCNICRQAEVKHKKIDWDERKKILDGIIAKYRDKGQYDCIVPFSGGKDSTFQLWYVVTQLKLKPLVVRFNHWATVRWWRKTTTALSKSWAWTCWSSRQTEGGKAAYAGGVEAHGRFLLVLPHGRFCPQPMQIAVKYGIPLVIWESLRPIPRIPLGGGGGGAKQQAFQRDDKPVQTADDMYGYLGGRVSMRDSCPLFFRRTRS
jgi:hypothetical protein